MKLNSETGLGDAAFLFLFVMAGLCMIVGAIKMFSVAFCGILICGGVALIIFIFKKRKP